MKVNIIRKTQFVARDKDGNEWPLWKFNGHPGGDQSESIEHVDASGELMRMASPIVYFKIDEKNAKS